jgi:hypothetical protein
LADRVSEHYGDLSPVTDCAPSETLDSCSADANLATVQYAGGTPTFLTMARYRSSEWRKSKTGSFLDEHQPRRVFPQSIFQVSQGLFFFSNTRIAGRISNGETYPLRARVVMSFTPHSSTALSPPRFKGMMRWRHCFRPAYEPQPFFQILL